ncbi:PfkB family carbohydrate kinase [Kiloniella laminariae]|uniref:PfkB family carbohydrate kinase n=1 Tax=Kiloniella laminariae TaxID=454162 RepID=UPI000369A00A|nr:PfkB family carbohydrate kinase [Kiloniella laminariae]
MSKLSDAYGYKVKTVSELLEAIGTFPREKKVVMCHGVFDLVHPGHLRHLLYAKDKANILVASLTSDQHINKAAYRPYVPQELRALNLAALEFVDYVIIDDNATPLANLREVMPDVFAKGFEYDNGQLHPKTVEELNVLNEYGGEILFTPGDVVYSSSTLIEKFPPNLSVEKLLAVLDGEGICSEELFLALNDFSDKKVLVVGDTIVDTLTHSTMIGGMSKTPTISVRRESVDSFVGGAGIVSKHIKAAGANVELLTVLGEDILGHFVKEDLARYGVTIHPVYETGRPTTEKNVIVAADYRLLKIDVVDNRPISNRTLETFIDIIKNRDYDLVIFSDFRHGIFNKTTISELVSAIPDTTFKAADSQVASRWGNITDFKQFNLVCPNEREARFSLADQDTGVRPLVAKLRQASKSDVVIMKMGERGVMVCRSDNENDVRSSFVIDSFASDVIDPVGAGDALLAYASLSLCSNQSPVIAAVLGSIAAALECAVDGNEPILPEDIRLRLEKIFSM